MSEDQHAFGRDRLQATVRADGAELCALHHDSAGDLLWRASEPWPRHSPVLFPIVGRVHGDRLHIDDKTYPMAQHGFARDRSFTWVDRTETGCRLLLEDDEASRAVFPFHFRLELAYAVQGETLTVDYRLSNPGEEDLYASLGAHPGFRWPLADGVAEGDHRIVFDTEEAEPLSRVDADGFLGGPKPSPVQWRTLPLDRPLFAEGALVFDRPASRSLRYEAPGVAALEIAWEGFEELGLWAREGGAFLCIEPWRGLADPADFHGDFKHKPGVMRIAPGSAEAMRWSVRFVEA